MPLNIATDFYTILAQDGRDVVLTDPVTNDQTEIKAIVTNIEAVVDPQTGQQIRAPKNAFSFSLLAILPSENLDGFLFETTDISGEAISGRIVETRVDRSMGMVNAIGEQFHD